MKFFGKSKAELKQEALPMLDSPTKPKHWLMKPLPSIRRIRMMLNDCGNRKEAKNNHESIAAESTELEKCRIEISKLEAEARAGFAEKQREAFKEAVGERIVELDALQQELNGLEKRLAVKSKNLHSSEGEIAKRELAVSDREQKLADSISKERLSLEKEKAKLVQREQSVITILQKRDTGFADERAALDLEIDKLREKKLSAVEDEISKLKTKRLEEVTKSEQAERDRIRKEVANELEAWSKQQEVIRKQLEAERTELEKQKSTVSALQSKLEGRKTELEANERTIERKEQRLEQQWQKRNDELDDKVEARLEEERKSLEVVKQSSKDENARLRESIRIQTELAGAFDQMKRQLGDKDPAEILRDLNSKTDELKRLREDLATRPTEEMREKNQEMESEAKRQKSQIEKLKSQHDVNAAAAAETADLRRKNSELDADNKSLAQKASRFEGAANEAQDELNRLRAAYQRPVEVAARYNEIEMPHIIADKAKRPEPPEKDSNGIVVEVDEIEWLKGVGNACDKYGLHFNPRIMKAFHTALKTAEWSPLTILAGVSGTGKSELPRLYSHFGGLIFEPLSVQPNWDSQESMLGFFNSIDNKFDAQPILRFLAQSQQSGNETYEKRIARWQKMSGNNIKLNPENEKEKELIEILKQSDYPGLKDCVCMVLLDEMNIAYPELYFAEFLSKLELRRGKKGADVPSLPVKIGAGMPPYQLPLGRNVLWTGTMNQDETTKSLSDKVLDRSIIIHFPRPTELKRRLNLAPLDKKNRPENLLHKDSWQSWLAQGSSFSEEDVKPFKIFIQEINESLAVAGRAIGHRVWQSVEYYMANYPDVRAEQKDFINRIKLASKKEFDKFGEERHKPVEYYMAEYPDVREAYMKIDKDKFNDALHIAFEDQLVQKVMPKLRGIDTLGDSQTKCLVAIRDKINIGIDGKPFNLDKDFDLACTLGYNQFIWQSANYLNENEANTESALSNSKSIAADEATIKPKSLDSNSNLKDELPSWFRPDDKKRKERWGKTSKEDKTRLIAEHEKMQQ